MGGVVPTFLLSILFVASLVSCQKIDFNEDFDYNREIGDTKFKVSLSNVKAYLAVINHEGSNKVKSITPLLHQADTILYVVNYENESGWKIIAADKRLYPIQAEDTIGNFDINKLEPGIFIWLDDLANRVNNHIISGIDDTTGVDYTFWSKLLYLEETKSGQVKFPNPQEDGYWRLISVTTSQLPSQQVGPLLPTKWGQGSPWNTCVPFDDRTLTARCPTGCVSVAGAQMLYYLNRNINKPRNTWAEGTCWGWSENDGNFLTSVYAYGFNFSNWNSQTWNHMPMRWFLGSEDEKTRVAVLMGYIGQKIDMSYGKDGSGARMNKLVDFFRSEGITCSNNVSYSSSTVLSSLNANMPVVVSADRFDGWATWLGIGWYKKYKGHAWVIDGYERRRTQYTYTYEWVVDGGILPLIKAIASKNNRIGDRKTEVSVSSTTFLIMNWGYDGSYDTGRYSLTGDWKTLSDRNYIYDRKIIHNFK